MIIHDPPENLIYGTVDAVAVSFRPAQTSRVKRSGLARFSRVHKTQRISCSKALGPTSKLNAFYAANYAGLNEPNFFIV